MPTCSCPHCGRTGIPFEMREAHSVLECAKCGGFFTPLGGPVTPRLADSATAEEDRATASPRTYDYYVPSPPRRSMMPLVIGLGVAFALVMGCGLLAVLIPTEEPKPVAHVEPARPEEFVMPPEAKVATGLLWGMASRSGE